MAPADSAPEFNVSLKPSLMKFMLFTNDDVLARAAAEATVDRLVVDLEKRGKYKRQHGYHLESNSQTVQDVARLRHVVSIPILCRINPINHRSQLEIEAAIQAGAQVLMLPMFRERNEVKHFLERVGGRVATSLLFETPEAIDLAPNLRDLPFDEAYVGLNDLAISLGMRFSYEILLSDVLDQLRACFYYKPFGFGGITLLGKGTPLSTELILKEQARLRCTRVIIRRAFKKDVFNKNMSEELALLRQFYLECQHRSNSQIAADRICLRQTLKEIEQHHNEVSVRAA
jgi:hypothetical protein